ncbi:hypothetical protein D3C76_1284340 [compost metagenome]
MLDTQQLGLNLRCSYHMPIRQVTKIQFHASLQAPVQGQFIDTESWLAAVGGRRIMPWRIHVSAAVRGKGQPLCRPGLFAGQLLQG